MVRARMSVVPPGANGTMYLIGLVGQDWAHTVPAASAYVATNTSMP